MIFTLRTHKWVVYPKNFKMRSVTLIRCKQRRRSVGFEYWLFFNILVFKENAHAES